MYVKFVSNHIPDVEVGSGYFTFILTGTCYFYVIDVSQSTQVFWFTYNLAVRGLPSVSDQDKYLLIDFGLKGNTLSLNLSGSNIGSININNIQSDVLQLADALVVPSYNAVLKLGVPKPSHYVVFKNFKSFDFKTERVVSGFILFYVV